MHLFLKYDKYNYERDKSMRIQDYFTKIVIAKIIKGVSIVQ